MAAERKRARALTGAMADCHAAVKIVFARAMQEPSAEARHDALKIAVRLLRADAAAAINFARLKSGEGGTPCQNPQNEYPAKPQINQAAKKSRAVKIRLKGAPSRSPGGQPGNTNARKTGCHSAGMLALRKETRRKIEAMKV